MAGELVRLSTGLVSNPDPQRTGGAITWAFGHLSTIRSARVGRISVPSKREDYLRFSQEMVYRTYAAFLREQGTTISSWQTREESMKKYGGEILFSPAEDKILKEAISFSGLDEHVCEAVSLVIGHELRQASDDHIKKVIAISNNQVYHELLQTFKKNR